MSQTKVQLVEGKSDQTITGSTLTTTTLNAANLNSGAFSNRNLVINGAMIISQRGTSFADPADNAYTLDRWKTRNSSGDPAFTWTKDSESPNGFASSLKCDCTTADTSLAAGDFHRLEYHFEGQDLQAFAKGTSSAKKGILSFYVKTNKTGVYVVNFYDNDNSRGFSASYTVSDSNWNRYTISIPADTTGAWGNDTGASLGVNWGLAIGSNRNSGSTGDLPTAWGAHANNTQFAGQVNFADSTSNDWYLTGVQLEVGETATDFEHRSYSDELARCQRYFVKYNQGFNTGARSGAGGGTIRYNYQLPVPLRAQPTISVPSGGSYSCKAYLTDGTSTSTNTPAVASGGYGWRENQPYIYAEQTGHSSTDDRVASIEASNTIELSSEL